MNTDDTPAYNGEAILSLAVRYTLQQPLALLNWHPSFTGRCPNCEMPIRQTQPQQVYWDCEQCGWMDESV